MISRDIANTEDPRVLARRLSELEADLARYRAALAGGHVGVWEADLGTGELHWDPATENLFGLPAGEFPGTRQAFYERVHPNDRERVQTLMVDAVGGDGAYAAEFRIVLPNGAIRWLACAGQVVRDASGRDDRVVGTAHDVTSEHEAQGRLRASVREKEALVKEVHHRVKNNLQIVSSLLHLQASQLADPGARAALRDSQARVRSMALVHEGVYRSGDLGRIDLTRHLGGLCADLMRAYTVDPERIQVSVRAAGTSIELDRAISCSLLVNELVANSLKHAFPDDRSGRVVVSVELLRDGGLLLEVSDDGVGISPALNFRETKTLGLQLVCSLTAQVEGTIDLDRTVGTTFRLTLPTARPAQGAS